MFQFLHISHSLLNIPIFRCTKLVVKKLAIPFLEGSSCGADVEETKTNSEISDQDDQKSSAPSSSSSLGYKDGLEIDITLCLFPSFYYFELVFIVSSVSFSRVTFAYVNVYTMIVVCLSMVKTFTRLE